jgi:hypothetical protein
MGGNHSRTVPDTTVLLDVDERHAPPSQPSLLVSVIEDNEDGILGGDVAALEIVSTKEDGKSRTYTVLASVTVDRVLLLEALGYYSPKED